MDSWKLYNGGWLSRMSPNEQPELSCIVSGEIWRYGGYLARWTEDFDCPYDTSWWYIVKDTPFDISHLKAKRRWEIKKGLENFDVRRIDGHDNARQIFEVYRAAFSVYPKKYRPTAKFEKIEDSFVRNKYFGEVIYGAFDKTGILKGFLRVHSSDGFYSLSEQKTVPEAEKDHVNAALVAGFLNDVSKEMQKGVMVYDGERNILHETRFHDYLIKYFGFRKAYCRLRIAYAPKIKWIIKVLYPFRKLLHGHNIRILDKIYAVLMMEQYSRECTQKCRGGL